MASFDSPNPEHPLAGDARAPTAAAREQPPRAAIADAADPVLTIGDGGRIEFFNEAAERMFGYAAEEVIDRPVTFLVSGPTRETLDCYLAEVFARSSDQVAGIGREIDGRRKDGSLFPICLSVCDQQFDEVTFTALLRDDVERRRLQDLLHRNRDLLDAISRVQALAITDRSEQVVFDELLQVLLQATESQFGFIGEVQYDDETPYLKLSAISNVAWNEEVRALYRKIASGGFELHNLDTLIGAVLRDQTPVITNSPASDPRSGGIPPGHPALESFMGLPFFGNDRLLGMVGVANRADGFDQDVAEFLEPLLGACSCVVEGCRMHRRRRQTERDLCAARDAAEAANRAKSDFLAAMSHEIRTPMTAILGFADILIDSNADSQTLDAAQTISSNGRYLLDLINDILDLSKIEAGKFEVEILPSSPTQIVSEVATLMRIRATKKNVPLEIEFEAGLPETVNTDPRALKQILINLVGNAIKFTNNGKVRLHSSWQADSSTSGVLKFQVVDEGIGMTPAQIAKLFKPFAQADSSTSRRFGGTGLGLTISKRLVEALGGEIKVTSSPGKGSTFAATIAAPLAAGPAQDSSSPHVRAGERSTRTRKNPLDGCRILLAEDGFDNQRIISFILQKAGATVVIAENGRIAVDLATSAIQEKRPFDAILMDLQMPVMDGYEATRRLRTEDYAGPIIALTAHAMEGYRQKAIDVGCDDFATKPIDPAALLSMIATYCH